MAPQLTIHVDGKGSVFRTAERAYVHLSISSTSTDQSKAFHDAQSTVAQLTSTFRKLATKTEDGRPHPSAGITAFTVAPLNTTSAYQRDKNHRELRNLPREHTVHASAELVFRNMTQLADMSNELATMPLVSINETEWRITEPTRAEIEREARLNAIRDAVQKAEDYAGVVGRQVVAVEITDVPAPYSYYGGTRVRQSAMMPQQMPQMAAHPAAAAAAAVTSDGPALEPKTITVSASVNVKFVSTDGHAEAMDVAA